MASNDSYPEAPLGHVWGMKQGTGDSKGQQRCLAGSCALALTSGGGSQQRRSPGHAVYGMQGVKALIGLAVPDRPIGPLRLVK